MPRGVLYRDQNTGATRRIEGRAPGYPWVRETAAQVVDVTPPPDDQVDQVDNLDDTPPAPPAKPKAKGRPRK